MTVVVRRGGAHDLRFLRDMLHHAYYWRERAPLVGDAGPMQRYLKGWGRPGDTAFVAVNEFFPVGAAWYRLFSRERPGYGFVNEHTPELAIAVVPARRGRGIGDSLLVRLLEQSRESGHRAVSLCVDRNNENAIHVYERHGFKRVAESPDSYTMVAQLTP